LLREKEVLMIGFGLILILHFIEWGNRGLKSSRLYACLVNCVGDRSIFVVIIDCDYQKELMKFNGQN
jgi:hypothetical protein